jgi:hypothetical protein
MGWIFAILFGVVTLAAFWWSGRFSRQALELALAAILVALAGYAWQGSPAMPGNPVHGIAR